MKLRGGIQRRVRGRRMEGWLSGELSEAPEEDEELEVPRVSKEPGTGEL